MAEYKICFSVAGAFGAQISFEAKPGVSYEDAAAEQRAYKVRRLRSRLEYAEQEG